MHHSKDYLNPELHDLWDYDPETGKFIWKIHTHGRGGKLKPGDEAGTLKDGYVQLLGRYRAHVLAWVWMTGTLPPQGREVDHRDKVRHHNWWTNLRLLGRGANNLNHSGPRRDSTTGVRGVYRSHYGDRFIARITIEKNIIHLGTFDTLDEAAAARREAETKFWNTKGV